MSTITFEELETDTYSALAGISKLRQSVENFCHLIYAAHATGKIIRQLKAADLENWNQDAVVELVMLVENLHRLTRIVTEKAKDEGVSRRFPYRGCFRKMEAGNVVIGDWIETQYLSMNKEFRSLIDSQIKNLNISKSPRDWRTSLAELQD